MAILTTEEQAYYADGGDHGNYRFISLTEIIDSFNATYVGKGKICENVTLNDVTFHAIRGLQELSYDTLRSAKDWEVEIPATLVLVMPLDYVSYIKLSWSDSNGLERVLYPATKTSNPFDVTPVVTDQGGFATGGANTDITGDEDSTTWSRFKSGNESVPSTSTSNSDAVDDVLFDSRQGRYGIDPQFAQSNGSFFIDESAGKFHFSSNVSGKTVVLKYLSDGVVTSNSSGTFTLDLANSLVPKFAEEAIYKHILYGSLLARKDSPAGLLAQIKKEKSAETRKAKLRLSNIKLEELTQILRGSSKIIKH